MYRAFVPLLLAVFAVALAASARFTQATLSGTAIEDQFYGFFFRFYPLFLFAMVYGVARIAVAATEPGMRLPLRALTAPLAGALFLAAGFYPTFGGVILRPGFATGGIGFLNGLPASAAAVLGAGAAAAMFGLVLGAAVMLAKAQIRFSRRGMANGILGFLALWVGAVILTAPERFGMSLLNDFPSRPLDWGQALAIGGLVAVALLPHALVVLRQASRDREGTAG